MNLEELTKIIKKAWSKETCYKGLREEWTKENPSLGQCAITSLIVNDMFGGKIMRCMTQQGSHYYNIINNEIIDLTIDQFSGRLPSYEQSEERIRDYILSNKETKERYELLVDNVNKIKDRY